MNRLFAQFFAACLAGLHVLFLCFLALALFGAMLEVPQLAPATAQVQSAAGGLPMPLVVVGLFVAYVLVMGVISTLIAINQNLERIAQGAERRGGYEHNDIQEHNT